MGLLLSIITGGVIWIVCWATGLMKSFDAFLVAMFLVLMVAATRMVLPALHGGSDKVDE